ncbi:MAG TPA: diaminopimelate epimerase [Acidimicrobiia bacterium]|nr:diaminopimelate epimerase [Acidimicrobiia bacterium]
MTELHLSKLHATANDFLVLADLDARFGPAGEPALAPGQRAALCDRRTGVGADGLIRILPGSDGADCTMELTNADGGLAEISGNGLRCLGAVADGLGLVHDDRLVVDTAAGRRTIEVARETPGGPVTWAVADMGAVSFEPERIPLDAPSAFDLEAIVEGTAYRGDAAGTGNPHFVIVVDDPARIPLDRHGPVLEHDHRFPRRTNVEMIAVRDGGLEMRVWERGVGETWSCGSGACAAAAVAHRRGLVPARTTVRVPGGDLTVEVGGTVRLGGPVVHVFDTDVPVGLPARRAGRVA